MAKSNIEKIGGIDEKMAQLAEQKKRLLQQERERERKAKNNRFTKRHGLLESMLPEVINLTDEQYKTFLERAVANDTVRKIIASITAQGAKPVDIKQNTTTAVDEETSP